MSFARQENRGLENKHGNKHVDCGHGTTEARPSAVGSRACVGNIDQVPTETTETGSASPASIDWDPSSSDEDSPSLEPEENDALNGSFLRACARGDVLEATTLVASRANFMCRDGRGRTTLILATMGGHTRVVDALLRAELDSTPGDEEEDDAVLGAACDWLVATDDAGFSALYYGLRGGHEAIVEMLCMYGAAFEMSLAEYQDMLMVATGIGRAKIVSLVLNARRQGERGALKVPDVAACFLAACKAGHSGVVWEFLKNRTIGCLDCMGDLRDVHVSVQRKTRLWNVVDGDGKSGIELAAEHGHAKLVAALIDIGILLRTSEAVTSRLLVFCMENDKTAVMTELARGMTKMDTSSCTGPDGSTPLMTAVTRGNDVLVDALSRIVSMLDVQSDSTGKTALMMACEAGRTAHVRMLLAAGASATLKSLQGYSALMYACSAGSEACVEALLEFGVQYTIERGIRSLALHIAITKGHTHIARLLLNASVHLYHMDNRGRTPFLLAVELGRTRIARAFAASGIDMTVQDAQGRTPLMIARERGDAEMEGVIISATRQRVDDTGTDDAAEHRGNRGHRKRAVPRDSDGAPEQNVWGERLNDIVERKRFRGGVPAPSASATGSGGAAGSGTTIPHPHKHVCLDWSDHKLRRELARANRDFHALLFHTFACKANVPHTGRLKWWMKTEVDAAKRGGVRKVNALRKRVKALVALNMTRFALGTEWEKRNEFKEEAWKCGWTKSLGRAAAERTCVSALLDKTLLGIRKRGKA